MSLVWYWPTDSEVEVSVQEIENLSWDIVQWDLIGSSQDNMTLQSFLELFRYL